ncbi:MAG: DUF5309 domain-containing protein [Vampirovibrio sp.]|nr:DUF5309 domain-containing protein [Vampirovibrio sp.]
MATPFASYELATDREDLADAISNLAERETPFLKKIMHSGLAATNTTHSWVNTRLVGFKDRLDGAIDNSATTIDVDGSFQGAPNKYVAGTVIKVEDEYMKITSVNSSTQVTVTRGYAGSTAASHVDNTQVDIVAKPKAEGFEPSESEHEFGIKDSNFTQIFSRFISLTGTSQAVKVAGAENQMSTQTERKLKELLKEVEREAILGIKFEDGSGDNRLFGGLQQFVTQENDAAAAALATSHIDTAVLELLENGAKPNTLLVSNIQKNALNNLKASRVEQAQSDKSISNLVDIYHSEAGPLKIVRSNDMPADSLYVLDSGLIKVVPLQKRRFAMVKLSKSGDLDKTMVIGEYTMEVRNPEAHYRIKNLAIS